MGVLSDPLDATVETNAPPDRPSVLIAGTTLGKYQLERVLGTGGVGIVWAAHDPDLERTVALKVLRSSGASTELRTRLLREARAMARLKHPNVLTVYEAGSQGDRDFIAMELVEGDSLDAWLTTEPPSDQIWQAILAAGRGLAAAHRAGLIHRDFKPQNVLRGNDGRVLVTDFGLARTHSGDTPSTPPADVEVMLPRRDDGASTLAIDATLDASSARSGFDAPLTRTGALLGTPAYMAPEQYLGAGSDPRTDQFAFCVTAWQLLAGQRPFEGRTLEELQRAVNGGAVNARGDLPRGIRRVLSRGLAANPAERWPDMNTLLVALERARKWPRRLLKVAIGTVVMTGIVLAVVAASRPRDRASEGAMSACNAPPETEMARAWSPAVRAAIEKRFAETRDAPRLLALFDSWAAQWIGELRRTCASAGSTPPHAELGCLMAERDVVGNWAEILPGAPPDAFYGADLGGILPRIEACAGDAPMTLPTMPKDAATQARIRELRPKVLAAQFGHPRKHLPEMPDLVERATKIGWAPLIAEAHKAYGLVLRRASQGWELSREEFKTATRIARGAHHYQLEADTTIWLLDGENDAATDPASDAEYRDLLKQARTAAENAGKDPSFLARIAMLEGAFAESRGDVDTAIASFEAARTIALGAGQYANAIDYTHIAALAIVRRDRPDDGERAWALLTDTERALAGANVTKENLARLWNDMALVAMLRGDLAAVRVASDRGGGPFAPADQDAVTVSGRVVDAAGKPVAGAEVVVWTDELSGDATRVYIGPGFQGAITTSDAAGNFTVRAPHGGGIIAELADKRSRPRLVGRAESIVLTLEPTRAFEGMVASEDTALSGLGLFVHFALTEKTSWRVGTAVQRSGAYRLGGIPQGDGVVRLDNRVDPNQPLRTLAFGPPRDGARLRWPTGVTLDVIVRNVPGDPMIIVFRGRRTPKKLEELEKLVATEPYVVRHPAYIVGIGDQTVEGMAVYRRGDHHGRFLGVEPGLVTVCIHGVKRVDVMCKTIDVPKTPPAQVRNGHGIYPVLPVLLEASR